MGLFGITHLDLWGEYFAEELIPFGETTPEYLVMENGLDYIAMGSSSFKYYFLMENDTDYVLAENETDYLGPENVAVIVGEAIEYFLMEGAVRNLDLVLESYTGYGYWVLEDDDSAVIYESTFIEVDYQDSWWLTLENRKDLWAMEDDAASLIEGEMTAQIDYILMEDNSSLLLIG